MEVATPAQGSQVAIWTSMPTCGLHYRTCIPSRNRNRYVDGIGQKRADVECRIVYGSALLCSQRTQEHAEAV